MRFRYFFFVGCSISSICYLLPMSSKGFGHCRSPWQGHQSVVRPVAPTSQLLACDDDGATVKSVILFFIFPTAFRARAMLTLVVTWIQATDHPVAGCSESCFTFHCLMISTAPHTFSLSLTYSTFRYKTVGFPLLDIPFSKAMLDL